MCACLETEARCIVRWGIIDVWTSFWGFPSILLVCVSVVCLEVWYCDASGLVFIVEHFFNCLGSFVFSYEFLDYRIVPDLRRMAFAFLLGLQIVLGIVSVVMIF